MYWLFNDFADVHAVLLANPGKLIGKNKGYRANKVALVAVVLRIRFYIGFDKFKQAFLQQVLCVVALPYFTDETCKGCEV